VTAEEIIEEAGRGRLGRQRHDGQSKADHGQRTSLLATDAHDETHPRTQCTLCRKSAAADKRFTRARRYAGDL
jgi:hypothetical protein